ncbi:MAG: phosphonate metabolism protein/1,5-bisphosphokinase (PRPP-forming) PhnN [Devosia sp.]
MAKGALVLVVGPSGAGKDTLIAAAREALVGDGRFVFPRRVVTRDAIAELEDHDSIGREGFEAARRHGAFALDWEAHGLCYALPGSIDAAIAAGRIVVANVSRRVIPEALRKYDRARVMLITAEAVVRARRLAGRGRESAEDVAARLKREGAPVPEGVTPVVIDNSGALERGITAFIAALGRIAAE